MNRYEWDVHDALDFSREIDSSIDTSNADESENFSRAALSSIISFTRAFRMLGKISSLPRFLDRSKQGNRQKRVNSFHLESRQRSITISTVIYELERALLRERNLAHARIKSIFCHTLMRGYPKPNLIYDGTLNDRSLSRNGLCQRADFSDWRVGRFVWLLAFKRNRHCAWFPLMRIYACIRSSIARFDVYLYLFIAMFVKFANSQSARFLHELLWK